MVNLLRFVRRTIPPVLMLQCMPLGLEQCLARMMLSIRKEAKGWRYRHRLHLGQVQGRLAYPRPP